MRMRPEDVKAAIERTIPNGVQCLHSTMIVPIPSPDGLMFALRVVSHGEPGDQSKANGYVNPSEIMVTDFGMGEGDLYELASAVLGMLDLQADLVQGQN